MLERSHNSPSFINLKQRSRCLSRSCGCPFDRGDEPNFRSRNGGFGEASLDAHLCPISSLSTGRIGFARLAFPDSLSLRRNGPPAADGGFTRPRCWWPRSSISETKTRFEKHRQGRPKAAARSGCERRKPEAKRSAVVRKVSCGSTESLTGGRGDAKGRRCRSSLRPRGPNRNLTRASPGGGRSRKPVLRVRPQDRRTGPGESRVTWRVTGTARDDEPELPRHGSVA